MSRSWAETVVSTITRDSSDGLIALSWWQQNSSPQKNWWVLDPALAQHLVGQVVGVLEDGQPRHHLVGSGGRPGSSV
jgi:hypothetical protein